MDFRIVLFSNLTSAFGTDNLEAVIENMKKGNVQMTFIGPEIEDEDAGDADSDSKDAKNTQIGDRNGSTQMGKPLSAQQLEGIKCIRGVLDQVDGEGMSFADILPMLSFFQTRSVKQTTTFRGPIEIGDTVKINVYGYVKAKELKAASFKKLSALSEASKHPGDMKVSMQRSHHLQDDDFTEVEDEHVTKAYKYGKTLVPYSKIDEQSLKMQTERCMKVLGFTDRSNIDESTFLGESTYFFVPQPNDKDAAIALSALVHALEEKDMVAIVRYCRCKNADPKLAVLVPVIKFSYEGLYMFYLPFSEDIRRYSFGSLENVGVSDEQISVIDSIIDGMDLSNVQNGDGEQSEAFKPKNILNPSIQRQYQCVQNRALHPEEGEIPKVDEYIKRSIEVLPEHSANCKQYVNKIKDLFPVKVVDKKGTKANQNVFLQSTESSEPDSKKLKTIGEDKDAMEFRFSSLLQESVTEVGTAQPIQDYETLIRKSDSQSFTSASNQMADRILQLVNDSFLDQYYQKALECLKKLREESVKAQNPDIFNELMDKIKRTMMGNRRNDFWGIVKAEQINMISRLECSNSRITDDVIEQFFGERDEKKAEEVHEADEEDVDDLLDMM